MVAVELLIKSSSGCLIGHPKGANVKVEMGTQDFGVNTKLHFGVQTAFWSSSQCTTQPGTCRASVGHCECSQLEFVG